MPLSDVFLCRLMQMGSGSKGILSQNRLGSAQKTAPAGDVGVARDERTPAQSWFAGTAEPVLVAGAGAPAAVVVDILRTAWAQRGTAAAARSFVCLGEAQCKEMDCRRLIDSGTRTVAVPAEDGMPSAVVALLGR